MFQRCILFFVLLLSASEYAPGQAAVHSEVIVRNDTVFQSNVPIVTLSVNKIGLRTDYSVRNMQGKEVMFWNSEFYKKPWTDAQGVKRESAVYYWEVSFPTQQVKMELGHDDIGHKPLGKIKEAQRVGEFIVKNALVLSDSLDAEAVQAVAFKYGTKYTEEKVAIERRNQKPDVIIIDRR